MMRYILCLIIIGLWLMPTYAQEPAPTDTITRLPIPYDVPVTGIITDSSYFDFWLFYATEGDEVLVRMMGADGLAPLIGIAGSNREVIVRSDMDANGVQLPDAEPNSVAELRFTIPAGRSGEFSIVATRVGIESGTTEGVYQLVITQTSSDAIRRDQARQAVEFRCGDQIVTSALNIQLPDPRQPTNYRLTVYGLEDFQPAIRIFGGAEDNYQFCTTDGQKTVGDSVAFWDESAITIGDDTTHTAQYGINSVGGAGQITFTIASVNGGRGRYIAVLEGLVLSEANQANPLDLQMGAIALGSPVTVYMVKHDATRIDPYIRQVNIETENWCDDAGGRGCEGVPSASSIRIALFDGVVVQGDRFSAGLTLTSETLDLINLQFMSRANQAIGGYYLVFIGELPELTDTP